MKQSIGFLMCVSTLIACDLPGGQRSERPELRVQGSAECEFPTLARTGNLTELELHLDNLVQALSSVRECDLEDGLRDEEYANILTDFRRSLEDWWTQTEQSQRSEGVGAKAFVGLEQHRAWAWYYLWSAEQLLDVQRRDPHSSANMRQSFELDRYPAAFVRTDAVVACALEEDADEDLRAKTEWLIELPDALRNEGRALTTLHANDKQMPLADYEQFSLRRADQIADNLFRLATDDRVDGLPHDFLAAAFADWAKQVATVVPMVHWPTPILLEPEPTVRLSLDVRYEPVSLTRVREDASSFDGGNLAAFFRVRREEQKWFSTMHAAFWLPSIEIREDAELAELDMDALFSLRDGLVRAAKYIVSREGRVREIAIWIANFQPAGYGEGQTLTGGDGNKLEALIQRTQAELTAAKTELAEAQIARTQRLPGSAHRLRDARAEFERLEDLASRLAAFQQSEGKRRRAFIEASIVASDTALCLMNSALFDGIEPEACLSTAERLPTCLGERKLHALWATGGRAQALASASYSRAIIARLKSTGIERRDLCHAEVLLNPDFISSMELTPESMLQLAYLLQRIVEHNEFESSDDHLARVYEAMLDYVVADYEDECRVANRAAPGACELSQYVEAVERDEATAVEAADASLQRRDPLEAVGQLCSLVFAYEGLMTAFGTGVSDYLSAHTMTWDDTRYHQLVSDFSLRKQACVYWEPRLEQAVRRRSARADEI